MIKTNSYYPFLLLILLISCKGINIDKPSSQRFDVEGDSVIISRWDNYLDFRDSSNGVVIIDYASKAISAHFKNASDEQVSNGTLLVGPYSINPEVDNANLYQLHESDKRTFFGTRKNISANGSMLFSDSLMLPYPIHLTIQKIDSIDRSTGMEITWEPQGNYMGIIVDVTFNPIGDPYNASKFEGTSKEGVNNRKIIPDNGYYMLSGDDFKDIPDSVVIMVNLYRHAYKPVRQNGNKILLEGYSSTQFWNYLK